MSCNLEPHPDPAEVARLEAAMLERCVPAAFVSESEIRFLAPSFAEAGDAKVSLALNGQEYEPSTELLLRYQAATSCVLQ